MRAKRDRWQAEWRGSELVASLVCGSNAAVRGTMAVTWKAFDPRAWCTRLRCQKREDRHENESQRGSHLGRSRSHVHVTPLQGLRRSIVVHQLVPVIRFLLAEHFQLKSNQQSNFRNLLHPSRTLEASSQCNLSSPSRAKSRAWNYTCFSDMETASSKTVHVTISSQAGVVSDPEYR